MNKTQGSVLKLDEDCQISAKWLRDWERLVVIPTCRRFGVRVRSIQTYPSKGKGKGFHVVVQLNKRIPPDKINKLQFMCGDDRQRVSMNRARIRAGLKEFNKLFVTPNMNPYANRVGIWERLRKVLARTKPKHRR